MADNLTSKWNIFGIPNPEFDVLISVLSWILETEPWDVRFANAASTDLYAIFIEAVNELKKIDSEHAPKIHVSEKHFGDFVAMANKIGGNMTGLKEELSLKVAGGADSQKNRFTKILSSSLAALTIASVPGGTNAFAAATSTNKPNATAGITKNHPNNKPGPTNASQQPKTPVGTNEHTIKDAMDTVKQSKPQLATPKANKSALNPLYVAGGLLGVLGAVGVTGFAVKKLILDKRTADLTHSAALALIEGFDPANANAKGDDNQKKEYEKINKEIPRVIKWATSMDLDKVTELVAPGKELSTYANKEKREALVKKIKELISMKNAEDKPIFSDLEAEKKAKGNLQALADKMKAMTTDAPKARDAAGPQTDKLPAAIEINRATLKSGAALDNPAGLSKYIQDSSNLGEFNADLMLEDPKSITNLSIDARTKMLDFGSLIPITTKIGGETVTGFALPVTKLDTIEQITAFISTICKGFGIEREIITKGESLPDIGSAKPEQITKFLTPPAADGPFSFDTTHHVIGAVPAGTKLLQPANMTDAFYEATKPGVDLAPWLAAMGARAVLGPQNETLESLRWLILVEALAKHNASTPPPKETKVTSISAEAPGTTPAGDDGQPDAALELEDRGFTAKPAFPIDQQLVDLLAELPEDIESPGTTPTNVVIEDDPKETGRIRAVVPAKATPTELPVMILAGILKASGGQEITKEDDVQKKLETIFPKDTPLTVYFGSTDPAKDTPQQKKMRRLSKAIIEAVNSQKLKNKIAMTPKTLVRVYSQSPARPQTAKPDQGAGVHTDAFEATPFRELFEKKNPLTGEPGPVTIGSLPLSEFPFQTVTLDDKRTVSPNTPVFLLSGLKNHGIATGPDVFGQIAALVSALGGLKLASGGDVNRDELVKAADLHQGPRAAFGFGYDGSDPIMQLGAWVVVYANLYATTDKEEEKAKWLIEGVKVLASLRDATLKYDGAAAATSVNPSTLKDAGEQLIKTINAAKSLINDGKISNDLGNKESIRNSLQKLADELKPVQATLSDIKTKDKEDGIKGLFSADARSDAAPTQATVSAMPSFTSDPTIDGLVRVAGTYTKSLVGTVLSVQEGEGNLSPAGLLVKMIASGDINAEDIARISSYDTSDDRSSWVLERAIKHGLIPNGTDLLTVLNSPFDQVLFREGALPRDYTGLPNANKKKILDALVKIIDTSPAIVLAAGTPKGKSHIADLIKQLQSGTAYRKKSIKQPKSTLQLGTLTGLGEGNVFPPEQEMEKFTLDEYKKAAPSIKAPPPSPTPYQISLAYVFGESVADLLKALNAALCQGDAAKVDQSGTAYYNKLNHDKPVAWKDAKHDTPAFLESDTTHIIKTGTGPNIVLDQMITCLEAGKTVYGPASRYGKRLAEITTQKELLERYAPGFLTESDGKKRTALLKKARFAAKNPVVGAHGTVGYFAPPAYDEGNSGRMTLTTELTAAATAKAGFHVTDTPMEQFVGALKEAIEKNPQPAEPLAKVCLDPNGKYDHQTGPGQLGAICADQAVACVARYLAVCQMKKATQLISDSAHESIYVGIVASTIRDFLVGMNDLVKTHPLVKPEDQKVKELVAKFNQRFADGSAGKAQAAEAKPGATTS
ncbi:MAG: hypothetical protein NkDv07_0744 [Candidatus Improbicoccus devescovinae]|nr:MAG: hypothetical protein NkDv07_0744 [Candidatus Improbicoccus devescovinae]